MFVLSFCCFVPAAPRECRLLLAGLLIVGKTCTAGSSRCDPCVAPVELGAAGLALSSWLSVRGEKKWSLRV